MINLFTVCISGQASCGSVLKLTALGAAAGTVVAGGAAQASEVELVSDGDYRETEHVKTYYELARF